MLRLIPPQGDNYSSSSRLSASTTEGDQISGIQLEVVPTLMIGEYDYCIKPTTEPQLHYVDSAGRQIVW